MIKLKLSAITMVLLCAIATISSRLKEDEVVGNTNTESTAAAILESNPNQSRNEEYFRDEKDKSKNVEVKTSKYNCVSWNKITKKWKAQLRLGQKNYYGGLFDNEEHAAMSVNLLCDKCLIKRKNLMIDIELPQVQNHTSPYTGVCWDNSAKRWKAELMHKRKKYLGGYFENEDHAAMKTNLLCDEFGIKRKNPMIDLEPDAIQQAQNLSSQYIGVFWNKENKKWRAQLMHKGKKCSTGLFDNEKHAAMKVNLLCDEFGIQRKNPMIDIKFEVKNPTSKYSGVCWVTREKKWQAQLTHNKKIYFGGKFDNEEQSAMSVNLLCDKCGIQRKNPMIDIEFDAIQQKRKSSKMHESKAENIVNEKEVKVEEENILYGLKDQCENNFMKQTCQSQKRKRKKNLVLNDVIEEPMVNTSLNHDENEVFEEIQKNYSIGDIK